MTIENLTDPKRQSKTGSDLHRRMRRNIRAEAATEAYCAEAQDSFPCYGSCIICPRSLLHTLMPPRGLLGSLSYCVLATRGKFLPTLNVTIASIKSSKF